MSSYLSAPYNDSCTSCNNNTAVCHCDNCGISLCNHELCCSTFVNYKKPDITICKNCVILIDNKLINATKNIIANELLIPYRYSIDNVDYCVGCNKKQLINCCDKCGDPVCIQNTCCTIFENNSNIPSTVLCKECIVDIEEKFVLYDPER